MNNQHSKSCRVDDCAQCLAELGSLVISHSEPETTNSRLIEFSEWLDNDLFRLEQAYEDFTTQDSLKLQLKSR